MLDQIISMLVTCYTAIFNWFTSILNSVPGSFKFIFTFFTLFLISRFILGPVVGSIPIIKKSEVTKVSNESKDNFKR